MELHDLVRSAVDQKASDIHIRPDRVPSFRIDGSIQWQSAQFRVLSATDTEDIIFGALDVQLRQQLVREKELDVSLQIDLADGPSIRLRVNIQHQQGGWGAVFRLITEKIPLPEDIDLEPAIQRLVDLPHGLILITGPTGSGKTTTLACLVELINQRYRRHILTIEDPIEYLYKPARCEITQRELGSHTHSFASALRSALRADPDVILVGEMRDLETIQLALTASETGHLVLSTLHTTDASQTVDRIIDVFPGAQQSLVRSQLASGLQAIVSQKLLPRAAGSGRVAVREFLLATPAIRNLIREQHTNQIYNALTSGTGQGMFTLEASLAARVRESVITAGEATAAANRPGALLSLLEDRRRPQEEG